KAARERLLDWAPRLKGPDARFVALFMREHSVSLAPRAWVDEADERCTERRARAVFDGMRRADRGALPTLLAYLDAADGHWAERPLAVRAFIDALIRLGAPAKRFTCRNELFDPCRMTSLRGAEQERNARIACLSAARAWLLVNGGLPQSAQGH
ncbi:MAG TPA: hypothetical protein VFQ35_28630, partial [Polyangiaceae bacterium]|nr:hypothetical protein [Polyangiaceae bacterium]